MKIMRTSAVALAGLLAATAGAEEQVFQPPMQAGYRVDICRVWGSECGQAAADEFCRLQGFERADMSMVDHDIGAVTPTRTLADGKICDQSFCDGFGAISCVRSGTGVQSSTTATTQPARPGRLKMPGWSASAAASPPAAQQPADQQPTGQHPAPQSPPEPSAPEWVFVDPPWTPKDVIRPNIDVQAQYALFRMLKRPAPAWRRQASILLSAVQSGSIKGIYQEDQQVPALRAQQVGKWWKQIIPSYESATCMKEPAGQAPIIVVRKGTPANQEEYDAWLTIAWDDCGIEASWPLHAYDASAPGDPPATGTMQHCKGTQGMAAALQLCQDLHQKSVTRCKQFWLQAAAGDQAMADQLEVAGGQPGCEDRQAAKFATCQQDAHAMCQ